MQDKSAAILLSKSLKSPSAEETLGLSDDDLIILYEIFMHINSHCGIDLYNYRLSTVIRRIHRRMTINGYRNFKDYYRFMLNGSDETNLLYRDILIGVTSFFRDKKAFTSLYANALPIIFSNPGKLINVWNIGCSTGEETYTLAMIFNDYMEQNNIHKTIKILATDSNSHSINIADKGVYSTKSKIHLTDTQLSKYFTLHDDKYHVKPILKSMIHFNVHDIITDKYYSNFDLIVCRNLLIYFRNDLQTRLIPLLIGSVRHKGILFLGPAESIGANHNSTVTLDKYRNIYQVVKT